MRRPQVGQVPSGGSELGFQNLEQSSHQGTPHHRSRAIFVDHDPTLLLREVGTQSRLRTRNLIGVAPNPHSSRNERSR